MPEQHAVAKKLPTKSNPATETFTVVEQQPEFPGGMRMLGQYLSKNLRYPVEAQKSKIQGKVFVRFVVTKTGEIQQLRVLKGIGSGCDEEAVRVVSQMPKWNPGKQNGKPVVVQFNLPIEFVLEKREDTRTGTTQKPTIRFSAGDSIRANAETGQVDLYDAGSVKPLTLFVSPMQSDTTTNSQQRYVMSLRDSLKSSGMPIRIRNKSFPNGEPLYIVDGVEIKKDGFNKFKPNDIESITVLKDAASKAQYGDKGVNGVVLITTKKK